MLVSNILSRVEDSHVLRRHPGYGVKGVKERLRFADQVKRGLFKHLSRTGIRSTETGGAGVHGKGRKGRGQWGAAGSSSPAASYPPLLCIQPCLHMVLVPSYPAS